MVRKTKTAGGYPPEFLDAWKLAVEGKLMLAVDSPGQARSLIQRLYTFRKRLMEEAPELAGKFYLVDLRVHDEMGNVITGKETNVPKKAIIRPYNPTWKDQIRKQMSEGGVPPVSVGQGELEPPSRLATTPELSSPPRPFDGGFLPSVGNGVPESDNMDEALSDLGYSTGKPE